MKSILDASFRYTPSVSTDVRKTFERIRREQRLRTRQLKGENAAPVERVRFPGRAVRGAARERRAGGD